MIELTPIRETTEDYDAIEEKIKRLFKLEIYLPILKEFYETSKSLKNSKEDLLWAVKSGQLTYNKGKFSGKLNSTFSKELRDLGAQWNKIQKCYSLPLSKMDYELKGAIALSAGAFEAKLKKVDEKLASIVPDELASKLKISSLFDKAIFKVDKDFKKSVKNITIAPRLSDEERQIIADKWQNNMKLWIKNFTEKQIKKLRADISKSYFAGNRYESAIKTIQKSYGVTADKAKFLARQETMLLMTAHKQARYQQVGINEYKWKCVKGTPAHPVRPMHQELNDRSNKGEIFKFDQPPVDDPNGSRHNPGENYNCRCVSIPVVRFNPK